MTDLDVDLDGLRLRELENYTYEAKQEIRRLRAANAELAAVARDLDEYQRYYAEHAWPSDGMPGNEFYCEKMMVIVRRARAALAAEATAVPGVNHASRD